MSDSIHDIEYFRNKMLDILNELKQQDLAGEEGTKTVELDQSRMGRLSRMDAMQNQAMAVEAKRRRKIYVQRINAALKRMDNNEYGLCTQCGTDINPERLEIDPTAVMCFECAEDM